MKENRSEKSLFLAHFCVLFIVSGIIIFGIIITSQPETQTFEYPVYDFSGGRVIYIENGILNVLETEYNNVKFVNSSKKILIREFEIILGFPVSKNYILYYPEKPSAT